MIQKAKKKKNHEFSANKLHKMTKEIMETCAQITMSLDFTAIDISE